MGSILSKALAILAIVLLIPTGAVLASQDAIPGDATYPLKRSLENIILTVASISPSTRAMFKSNLSKRRFKEAIALIQRGDERSTQSLAELVAQTRAAADALNQIQDSNLKKQYSQNLAKQIDEYKSKLQAQEVKKSLEPTFTPTPLPTKDGYNASPTPEHLPSLSPTASPLPTPIARPTPVITPIPQPTLDPIKDTVDDLDEIQKELGNLSAGFEEEGISPHKGNENRGKEESGEHREEKKEEESKQSGHQGSSEEKKGKNQIEENHKSLFWTSNPIKISR